MMAATTVVRVTTSEMLSAEPNEGSVATALRLSSEPPNGRNVGLADWSTTLGRKAEFSIQYTGKAQTTASTRARVVSRVRFTRVRGITRRPS